MSSERKCGNISERFTIVSCCYFQCIKLLAISPLLSINFKLMRMKECPLQKGGLVSINAISSEYSCVNFIKRYVSQVMSTSRAEAMLKIDPIKIIIDSLHGLVETSIFL